MIDKERGRQGAAAPAGDLRLRGPRAGPTGRYSPTRGFAGLARMALRGCPCRVRGSYDARALVNCRTAENASIAPYSRSSPP